MLSYNIVRVDERGEYDETFHIWDTNIPLAKGDILHIYDLNCEVFMITRAKTDLGEEIFTALVKILVFEEDVVITDI